MAQVAPGVADGPGEDIIPIPSAKSRRHLEENLEAVALQLTRDNLAQLAASITHPNVVRDQRGLSLLENLIAVALVGFILAAYLTLLNTGFKSNDPVDARVTAQNLVRVQMEYIRSQSYFEPPTSTYLIPPGSDPGAYAVPPARVTPPSDFDITVEITQYCDDSTCYPIEEIQQVRARVGNRFSISLLICSSTAS